MRPVNLVLLAIALAFAFILGRRTAPIRTETVYFPTVVERPRLERQDTAKAARPEVRIIYRERPPIVRDTCSVPEGLERYDLIPPEPVRIEPARAILTYFRQDSLRWEQAVYRVPERPWRGGLYLTSGLSATHRLEDRRIYGGIGGAIAYRRSLAFVEMTTAGVRFGMRLTVFP